jgi:hypothetical protein
MPSEESNRRLISLIVVYLIFHALFTVYITSVPDFETYDSDLALFINILFRIGQDLLQLDVFLQFWLLISFRLFKEIRFPLIFVCFLNIGMYTWYYYDGFKPEHMQGDWTSYFTSVVLFIKVMFIIFSSIGFPVYFLITGILRKLKKSS